MGKGLRKQSASITTASDILEGGNLPPLQGETLRKVERMNQEILAGKSPRAAQRLISPNKPSIETALQKSMTIVERNREMFKRVGMKKEAPYKVLMDIMQNATKTMPITKFNQVTGKDSLVYELFPDYTARLSAARQVGTLMGLDPRAEMKVNIQTNGRGGSVVSVQFGEQYIAIANMTDEAASLAAYNDLQRNQKTEGYRVVRDEPIPDSADAEFSVTENQLVSLRDN